ncbi:MAG: alanine--tRNA ligase [Acidobacteriota bacterium]
MTGHEIRQKFLDYFAERGHRIVKSSPLLPANDPTLLFTNAGMNQFKDVFLGAEQRDYKRATSSQKCIRAGGKHNDLDEVGRTTRHHTFFEMLGNFSFGDYFKKEAIYFSWDLLVNVFGLDPKRLWFTVFGGDDEVPADDEAARYWEQVGAPPERILRFGRKDNFWQMGETGPCGPCSEIHYYQGEHPEDPEFNRAEYVNGTGDITMEIWNDVFMQYNRYVKPGTENQYVLDPLPAPSVDTGMGLERITAVIQGVSSNYETDLIKPIINFIAELAGKVYVYDSPEGFAMRVLADHARSASFSIADGIAPGNVGRNYVLRKILRRAIYHGITGLKLQPPFFHKVCEFVIELMKEPYPELIAARPAIVEIVQREERSYSRILNIAEPRSAEVFNKYKDEMPPMSELAKLYDTYGVPTDLIRVKLSQRGWDIEENEFTEQFNAAIAELQQSGAQEATTIAKRTSPIYGLAARLTINFAPRFIGYEELETSNARVLAIIVDGKLRAIDNDAPEGPLAYDNKPVINNKPLLAGENGEVLLSSTPFYAEAGGQVGDTGILEGENILATVQDTFSPSQGFIFHKVKIESGQLNVGDSVTARVDAERRRKIKANHTGTHLLHAALREVLGPHVKQAGSLVAPDRLRFDFSHYAPLSAEEIAEIEELVNREILLNRPTQTELKSYDEAVKSGAMALFGEKYGSTVRVVSVPGFSTELCGGTHVRATGDIGPFKIISDSSIAAGVRRLEAVTADAAIARFQADEQVVTELTQSLKVTPNELPQAIDKLQEQVRKYEREIEQLKLKIAQSAAASATENARQIADIKALATEVSNLDANGMRQLADNLSQKIKSGVVVLGQKGDGKVSLVVRVSDDLTKRLNAGQIVREVSAFVGGKGGGRPDMATGGGAQVENLESALEASYKVVEQMLNGK